MSISRNEVAIDSEIAATLARYAQRMNMDVEQIVDNILTSFIQTTGLTPSVTEEKRRFQRKKVVMPAIAYEKSLISNSGRYFATTLLDISIGGTKLFFPQEKYDKIEFLKTENNFDIIFCFFKTDNISRFTCRLTHAEKDGVNITVGGSFIYSDTYSYEQLNKYFSKSDI